MNNEKYTTVTLIALLGLFITIFFNHCAKEYSYEGGPTDSTIITPPPAGTPAAGFTLSGSPDCTDPAIKGTYEAGNKLTIANYIDVIVDVSSLGTYSISTDTIDGISFSASGTFTKTGSQRISMMGNGTPVAPANLTFAVNAGNSACNLKLTVVMPGYPATYVLESNYDSSCTAHTVQGIYIAGVALTVGNKVTIKTYATIPGVYALSTDQLNGVYFAGYGQIVSAGINYVDLIGVGTPVAKGTFTYKLLIIGPAPLGGSGCDFDVTFN